MVIDLSMLIVSLIVCAAQIRIYNRIGIVTVQITRYGEEN